MLGDVVGNSGLVAIKEKLPALLEQCKAELCVCNGENAANGFGITEDNVKELLDAGIDLISSGNQIGRAHV